MGHIDLSGFDGRLVPTWIGDDAAIKLVEDLAEQQALAGPARDKDVGYFVDRPVRDLVRQIFIDHLSRLRKVAIRTRVKVEKRADRDPASAGVSDQSRPNRQAAIDLVVDRLTTDAALLRRGLPRSRGMRRSRTCPRLR